MIIGAIRSFMKYTAKYLRYVLLTVLGIIYVFGWATGAVGIIIGLIGFLAECNPSFLILVVAGIFSGFMGFVAFDISNDLVNKWRL